VFSILKLKNKSLIILKKDDTTLFCRVLATKSTPHWAKDTTSPFYFVVFVVFCRVNNLES